MYRKNLSQYLSAHLLTVMIFCCLPVMNLQAESDVTPSCQDKLQGLQNLYHHLLAHQVEVDEQTLTLQELQDERDDLMVRIIFFEGLQEMRENYRDFIAQVGQLDMSAVSEQDTDAFLGQQEVLERGLEVTERLALLEQLTDGISNLEECEDNPDHQLCRAYDDPESLEGGAGQSQSIRTMLEGFFAAYDATSDQQREELMREFNRQLVAIEDSEGVRPHEILQVLTSTAEEGRSFSSSLPEVPQVSRFFEVEEYRACLIEHGPSSCQLQSVGNPPELSEALAQYQQSLRDLQQTIHDSQIDTLTELSHARLFFAEQFGPLLEGTIEQAGNLSVDNDLNSSLARQTEQEISQMRDNTIDRLDQIKSDIDQRIANIQSISNARPASERRPASGHPTVEQFCSMTADSAEATIEQCLIASEQHFSDADLDTVQARERLQEIEQQIAQLNEHDEIKQLDFLYAIFTQQYLNACIFEDTESEGLISCPYVSITQGEQAVDILVDTSRQAMAAIRTDRIGRLRAQLFADQDTADFCQQQAIEGIDCERVKNDTLRSFVDRIPEPIRDVGSAFAAAGSAALSVVQSSSESSDHEAPAAQSRQRTPSEASETSEETPLWTWDPGRDWDRLESQGILDFDRDGNFLGVVARENRGVMFARAAGTGMMTHGLPMFFQHQQNRAWMEYHTQAALGYKYQQAVWENYVNQMNHFGYPHRGFGRSPFYNFLGNPYGHHSPRGRLSHGERGYYNP